MNYYFLPKVSFLWGQDTAQTQHTGTLTTVCAPPLFSIDSKHCIVFLYYYFCALLQVFLKPLVQNFLRHNLSEYNTPSKEEHRGCKKALAGREKGTLSGIIIVTRTFCLPHKTVEYRQ